MNTYIYEKSFLAGMLIGLGVLVNISVGNYYIGAALFALGLLAVVEFQAYLYTGKIGYATKHKFSFCEYIIMLISNCLGVMATVACGLIARPELMSMITSGSIIKYGRHPLELFASSILCGMCVYFAVAGKSKMITLMAVMVFILCEFEHCIADFPFLLLGDGISFLWLGKWILIVVGNSIGAIISNILQQPYAVQIDTNKEGEEHEE